MHEYRRAVRRTRMVYIKITGFQKKIDGLHKAKETHEIQLKVLFFSSYLLLLLLSFLPRSSLHQSDWLFFSIQGHVLTCSIGLILNRPSRRTLSCRRRKRRRCAAWRPGSRGSSRRSRRWPSPTCRGTRTSRARSQPTDRRGSRGWRPRAASSSPWKT